MTTHSLPPFESDALSGRTILVTGAGSGLGEAVAKACAAHGATVGLMGRRVQKLEKVYDSILSAGGPEPGLFPLDFSQLTDSQAHTLAHGVAQMFEGLDAIVHCAAWLGSLTPVTHYPLEQWQRVFQINLHAPFLLTQALVPLLKLSPRDPSIIFTGDAIGQQPKAYWGAYGASKAALAHMAGLLAEELDTDTGIRVEHITPPPMQTALRAQAYPGEAMGAHPFPETLTPVYLKALLGR